MGDETGMVQMYNKCVTAAYRKRGSVQAEKTSGRHREQRLRGKRRERDEREWKECTER